MIPIIGNLIWLLALGAIIVLIVRSLNRREGGDRQRSGVTIRRIFQYSLMLALLGVVASGMAGLIEQILPGGDASAAGDTTALARSIAFVVVGGPALAALAVWNARLHTADPEERHSLAFAFYLTGALSASLIVGGFAAFRTLRWVLAESGYDESALAVTVVAAVVWAVHWRIAGRFGSAARMEPNLVIGSVAGLAGTAVAVGFGLAVALGGIYDAAFDTSVVDSLADGLRAAAAGALVAAPAWWWHWRDQASREVRTPLWHAYVLLIGVLGSLLTAMVAAGTTLFLVLEWLIGDPDTASSALWFDPMPGAVAALVVGSLGWWYHRLALATETSVRRSEVDRAYEYLVAAAGLVAGSIGATALLAALVEAVTPGGRSFAEDGGTDVLVFSLTMLGVGLPLWAAYWSRIRHTVRSAGMAERASGARRAYVLLVAGLGGAILPFAVLSIVIVGLEGLLDGRFGWETVRDMRVGIALTVVSAAVAGSHLAALLTDRAVLPAEARPAVRDVVLVTGDGAGMAAALSEQVGARVRVWHRLDVAPGPEPPVDAVVAAVRAETHERVMVLTGPGGGFEVVPFDDR